MSAGRLPHLAPLLALTMLGCGDDRGVGDPTEPPGDDDPVEDGCAPPNRVVGQTCLEPGVQDDGCPAGTLGLDDGTCQPAGVPPHLCAEGFVHDGEAACEPTLPDRPCAPGMMALPGDPSCSAIASCGSGQWGNIPIDAATVHVDAAYSGGASDGSASQPFTTIGAAVATASDDALIAVAAGTYLEDVVIERPLRLWGVCPEQVQLVGVGTNPGALIVGTGASKTEVRGLAVTGPNTFAIGVTDAEDVLLEELWIANATGRGLNFEDLLGPVSVTLRRTLVEGAHEFGVFLAGADATLEDVVVRDTQPEAPGQPFGRGVHLQVHTQTQSPSSAQVRHSVIERNHDTGIYGYGSTVSLDGVVVRDTIPRTDDGGGGAGISLFDDGQGAQADISRSFFSGNAEVSVFLSGIEARVDGVVVRDTAPAPAPSGVGRGIGIQPDFATSIPSRVELSHSLVEGSHEAGVFISGSQATVSGLWLRDTQPSPTAESAAGFAALDDATHAASADVVVKSTRIDDSPHIGLFGAAARLVVDGVAVRGVFPNTETGLLGIGINLEPSATDSSSASIDVHRSLVDGAHTVGLVAFEVSANVGDTVVRGTEAAADDLFGDGVIVISDSGPALLVLDSSLVESNDRAGVASFSAEIAVSDSSITCNAIDLVGEDQTGAFSFDNRGGNVCGCGEAASECKVSSTGLEPPSLAAGF